ncbi:MAG: DUF1599 domain-containing protein [Saprospiraceae bacterium]
MKNTSQQFDDIIESTKTIFENKMLDYGATWRILRPISIVDQLFIKAKRIRSIQNSGIQKIDEPVSGEFIAIFNYSIMALIQLSLDFTEEPDLSFSDAIELYDEKVKLVKDLMMDKNHDYGEAWREMEIISIADIILVKLFRIKQIISNSGKTLISEGIDSNIIDIANYSIFALILLKEKNL